MHAASPADLRTVRNIKSLGTDKDPQAAMTGAKPTRASKYGYSLSSYRQREVYRSLLPRCRIMDKVMIERGLARWIGMLGTGTAEGTRSGEGGTKRLPVRVKGNLSGRTVEWGLPADTADESTWK